MSLQVTTLLLKCLCSQTVIKAQDFVSCATAKERKQER